MKESWFYRSVNVSDLADLMGLPDDVEIKTIRVGQSVSKIGPGVDHEQPCLFIDLVGPAERYDGTEKQIVAPYYLPLEISHLEIASAVVKPLDKLSVQVGAQSDG